MKFRTKSGRLTRYAFGCGYVEQKQHDDGSVTSIYWESCCFHVRRYDYVNHKRILWETAVNLKDARKLFDKQK
jgi:hypothetical protein